MTTKLATPQYIYPPRATTCIPRDDMSMFGEMGWIAQLKYNGARCCIQYLPNGKIELWGRHAERFKKYRAPDWLLGELEDIKLALGLNNNEWSYLDSELIDFKHEAIRDTIAIFDILVKNNEYLIGTKYRERMATLYGGIQGIWHYNPPHGKHEPINFGHKLHNHILVPGEYQSEAWNGLWDIVHKVNAPYDEVGKGPLLEGLVAKDPNGELSRAWNEQNNSEWMTRSRVETGRHKF